MNELKIENDFIHTYNIKYRKFSILYYNIITRLPLFPDFHCLINCYYKLRKREKTMKMP